MGFKRREPKRSRAVVKGLQAVADMIELGKPPRPDEQFYVAEATRWMRRMVAFDRGEPDPGRPKPEPECVGDT